LPAPDALDVRILADDLTGALDSAVSFAGAAGIAATWGRGAPGQRVAVDAATREADEAAAVARHASLANWLGAGALRFKKVDSLLRGYPASETAACLAGMDYERVIVAPAFPFHGRVTRNGRQWLLHPSPIAIGPDLGAIFGPESALAGKIIVRDAETDADLDRIVAAEISTATSILWVGSGGLAAALARHLDVRPPIATPLSAPFLGLIGTDHGVTAAQAQRFATRYPGGLIALADAGAARRTLTTRMESGAATLVGVVGSGERRLMAVRIAEAFAAILARCPKPGALFVTGGETLRVVCDCLGAARLVVQREIEPGAPLSRISGGRYDGVAVISKSGGFGDADLIVRLSLVCGAVPTIA
jgi:uncharacterized protein YgbK (DUF1537 family)